jgi:hypothetical protein
VTAARSGSARVLLQYGFGPGLKKAPTLLAKVAELADAPA